MPTSTPLSQIPTSDLRRLQQSLQNSPSGTPLTGDELSRLVSSISTTAGRRPEGLSSQDFDLMLAAESSLFEFTRQAWPIIEPTHEFIDGWHIEALCLHLEALLAGKLTDNFLANLPPACSKSSVFAVMWPAWGWLHDPSLRWMFASYDANLAIRDSVRCRQVIESDWYRARWGKRYRLIDDQNQKTKYETSERGWRMATSVGGRGTGEHPDIVGVDDPTNVKQSVSDAEREAANAWFDGTISSRGVVRGSKRAIAMQRLHTDDLSGHVMAKDPDAWTTFILPMWAEPDRMKTTPLGWNDPRKPGELLWPEAITEKMARKMERDLTPRRAAGQLQQRPVPLSGAMVNRGWFRLCDAVPREARRVRYWDKAGTESGGAYTVGALLAMTGDGQIYVEDIVRAQLSWHKRNQLMVATAERDRMKYGNVVVIWIEREPGSGGKESSEQSVIYLQGFMVRVDRVMDAKEVRARPFADQIEAGNVHVLRAPWTNDFLDEWETFPDSKYKDIVDSSAGAFAKLALGRSGTIDSLVTSDEEDEDGQRIVAGDEDLNDGLRALLIGKQDD